MRSHTLLALAFAALATSASSAAAAPWRHARHTLHRRLPPVIRDITPDSMIFMEGTSNPDQFPKFCDAVIHGAHFRRGDIVRCDGVDLPKRLRMKYRSSHALRIVLTEDDVRGSTQMYEGVTAKITVYDPISKAASNTVLIKVGSHIYGG